MSSATVDPMRMAIPDVSLIESEGFDFEFLSQVGEKESWRKEIHRPIYHVHKWWAKRLGSVFRGIILGAVSTPATDLRKAFYSPDLRGAPVILDPFMGSGTTLGEAHKLGCVALGQDINPVACRAVRTGLGRLDIDSLSAAFADVEKSAGDKIRSLYFTLDRNGNPAETLYFFWVKQLPCNACESQVDLFPNRIIARNAYPKRKTEVQVCCPGCGYLYQDPDIKPESRCPECSCAFDPRVGSATAREFQCASCGSRTSIMEAVRRSDSPPSHRLFGKLVLRSDHSKEYLRVTDADLSAYDSACRLLEAEVNAQSITLPKGELRPGHNTKQALNYNYKEWRDFFNARQLLALGWLQGAILDLEAGPSREALLTLFSGVLEFNNMFASYKGEGTGAVRHMFSHHVLKPERLPIEANVWGTEKSSGSFATLFSSRLLRAAQYQQAPTEIVIESSRKASAQNNPFSKPVAPWPRNPRQSSPGVYVSEGSSDRMALPDHSVDLVVTDPPFFDNVHYSELADFFYAWQRLAVDDAETTRSLREVQDADSEKFARKLMAVFSECHRVLREDGLLVFTFHHSRAEGWIALADAISGSGFDVSAVQPVRAEMTVATPKAQSKDPIQIDIIVVCRKQQSTNGWHEVAPPFQRAESKVIRLRAAGMKLSLGDRRMVAYAECLVAPAIRPRDGSAAFGVQCQANEIETFLAQTEDQNLEAVPNGSSSAQRNLFAS